MCIRDRLEGELDFRHCLKINQVNMQKQIESMNEIKDTIDDYYDKDCLLYTSSLSFLVIPPCILRLKSVVLGLIKATVYCKSRRYFNKAK